MTMRRVTYSGPAVELDGVGGSTFIEWDILTQAERDAAIRAHTQPQADADAIALLIKYYAGATDGIWTIRVGSALMHRLSDPCSADCTEWVATRFTPYARPIDRLKKKAQP